MKRTTVIRGASLSPGPTLPLIYTLEYMDVYIFFSDSIVSEHTALVKSLEGGGSFQNYFFP